MKHNNRKRYNDDFRKMVVDLYHSDQSVRNLEIYNESKGRYGAPEIHHYLSGEGYHLSP